MEQKEHADLPLDLIVQNMPEAVIVTDRKWMISFMNPAAMELTCSTQKTALGKKFSDVVKLFDRHKNKKINITNHRSFQHDRKPYTYWNCTLESNSPKEIFVDVTFASIPGAKGTSYGYIVTFKDISERTNQEKEYLNKQKIEAISNMANSLAHDFTNSLGIISGHASSIADNLIPKTRAHEEAVRILEAVKRVGNVTKHLMSIARIGSTKNDMKVDAVPLGNIVKDAINIMEESFPNQNISFRIRSPESMPYIIADDRQMLDCLINLLLNSIDAMPDGGSITIDTEDTTFRKTSYVVLRIRDNGHGMSKDVLLHVFEPFYTTKSSGLGAGLGLTVVQNSIERWGGFIKIRSRPQQGTSIRLFLRKAKAQPAKETVHELKAGGETILFIDNSDSVIGKSILALKHAGYNVYTAQNGNEGLELYRKNVDKIDLSIIDLVMPGTDGKKVLEEILALNPTASIIMTSGFSRDYLRTSLERGAWGFIQKPFSTDHLLTTVRKMLDQDSIIKAESFTN
ncbi:MAG: ATP-binding protein [Kiritimatiellae bacterium]|nr:ATP-binding protein [Kiritimatiellia bacterium]MDD5521356.1 ATP-binding protein [Kiritimatiellia bacterium]